MKSKSKRITCTCSEDMNFILYIILNKNKNNGNNVRKRKWSADPLIHSSRRSVDSKQEEEHSKASTLTSKRRFSTSNDHSGSKKSEPNLQTTNNRSSRNVLDKTNSQTRPNGRTSPPKQNYQISQSRFGLKTRKTRKNFLNWTDKKNLLSATRL